MEYDDPTRELVALSLWLAYGSLQMIFYDFNSMFFDICNHLFTDNIYGRPCFDVLCYVIVLLRVVLYSSCS